MKHLSWLLAGCSVGSSDANTDSTANIIHTGGLRILTGMDAVETASVTGVGEGCGRDPTVALGDLTGDGVPDLVVACNDAGVTADDFTDLYVLDGAAALDDAFTAVATMSDADLNGFTSVGDLDGDGLTDVGFGVVGRLLSESELVWWFVRPGSSFVGNTTAMSGAWTITGDGGDPGQDPPVSVGDLDADGVPDLFVGQRPASYAVSGTDLLTSGTLSVVTDALRTIGGFAEDERALDFAPVGDVDGDNSPDVATVVVDWSMEDGGGDNYVAATVVRGESVSDPGTTMRILGSKRGTDRGGQVEVLGDLDGDSMPELAVLLSMDDTVEIAVVPSVVLAAGVDVSIVPYLLGGGEADARELTTCDLDGDGLLELVSDAGIWDGRDLLVPGATPVGPGVEIASCAGDLDGAPGSELVRGTPEGY